jgi:hypothetical protein
VTGCARCGAFDAAERAAFEGDAILAHELTCACERQPELDVLYVPRERFRRTPQVGVPCRVTWTELARYLARPASADAKDAAGAWSPALYRNNVRRKSNVVTVGALVVDVDEGGDVGRVADALGRYRGIVHSTFSSSPESPRCRIVLALAQPLDAPTYSRTHAVVRWHLGQAGVIADEGAKDASRLSYTPVVRAGAAYSFRAIDGVPLDACAVLAAQPPAVHPPWRSMSVGDPSERPDAYARSALRRGAGEVASADAGARHYTLSRESFTLARLGLPEDEIAGMLLPAFVASAGEARRAEGLRTIRDAVRARRGCP